jgi:hypothetical protein
MTPHQMICHLHDSFQAATGERAVSAAGNVLHRTVVKWIGLYAPMAWPKGVPTRPEMDQLVGGTPPAEFKNDLEKLRAMVERFSREPRDFDWHLHPLFGDLTTRDWLRWGYLHVDHHLRQFGL